MVDPQQTKAPQIRMRTTYLYIDRLVQNCNNSSVLAIEL